MLRPIPDGSFHRKFREKFHLVSMASQISDRVCEGALPWDNKSQ
jgi:hypothetical protein